MCMRPHSCSLLADTWTARIWAAPPSGWEWRWAPLWSQSWASPSTEPLPDWNDLLPAELHRSTTLPSLLKKTKTWQHQLSKAPGNLPHTTTINFMPLSGALDCRIWKESGKRPIALTLLCPAFSALLCSARPSRKCKEPLVSKQVLYQRAPMQEPSLSSVMRHCWHFTHMQCFMLFWLFSTLNNAKWLRLENQRAAHGFFFSFLFFLTRLTGCLSYISC